MTTKTLICRLDEGVVEAADPNLVAIAHLCKQPELITEHARGADRLVLALHWDAYALAEIQAQSRLLGLDPFGVQILHLPNEPRPGLGVALSGLAARAAAFTDSKPEHAKAVTPQRVSRRALLTLPKPEYVAAPLVDTQVCAAADGCKACAEACPQEAYRWANGRISFNKDACEPCGRCVTACPTAAITNPAVTPDQLRAQIETIISVSVEPVGIAFVCRRGGARVANDWQTVKVPCTAMVPGTWLVAALLLGAGAATALPCSQTGCPLGQDDVTSENVWFARSLLAKSGENPERVPRKPAPLLPPMETVKLADPFGLKGPAEVVQALMALIGRRSTIRFKHAGAPLGTIDINAETCTACMTCASTCPTGALGHDFTNDTVRLSFDAALCTACGQCVSRCPELKRGAISLTPGVDTHLLAIGPSLVHESTVSRCESCGQPVAPQATLDRLGALLGDGHDATMEYLATRCVNCRGKW